MAEAHRHMHMLSGATQTNITRAHLQKEQLIVDLAQVHIALETTLESLEKIGVLASGQGHQCRRQLCGAVAQ